jgi:hypothetical protein
VSEYEAFWCIYAILGAMFTVIEHNRYEFDCTDMPKLSIVLNIMQQLIHYTRYMVTWPLYMLEDMVILADNLHYEDGEDDGNEEE